MFITVKEVLYIDMCVYTHTRTHTYKTPSIKIMEGWREAFECGSFVTSNPSIDISLVIFFQKRDDSRLAHHQAINTKVRLVILFGAKIVKDL